MGVFYVELYEEAGTSAPGPGIGGTGVSAPGLQAPPSASPGWISYDLPSSAAYSGLSAAFRLCLMGDGLGWDRLATLDGDGVTAASVVRTNVPQGWALAADRGVTGDFILRPIVELSDLTPWQPGGACHSTPTDAGVLDAGPIDAGPADAEAEDAGELDGGVVDAASPVDAGEADAGPPGDAALADLGAGDAEPGAFDVGGTEADGGLPGAAPTIGSISPRQGLNDRPTDVLVTGSGFVSGSRLEIGQIPAVEVSVPGATTLLAKVPAGIAPGVYDVVVRNPDLQAAVLPQAYTVLDPSGAGNLPEDDCGCRSVAEGGPGAWWALALLLLARRRKTA